MIVLAIIGLLHLVLLLVGLLTFVVDLIVIVLKTRILMRAPSLMAMATSYNRITRARRPLVAIVGCAARPTPSVRRTSSLLT